MAQILPKDRDLISWLENKVSVLSSSSTTNNNNNHVSGAAAAAFFFDDEIGNKNLQNQNRSIIQQQSNNSGAGLWNCRNVSGLLNAELLTEIQSFFVDLQTPVKLKLLLSILHLSRRNIDQWRNELEDLLSLAGQDIDEWVQTAAELLKDVPTLGSLNFNLHNDQSQFTKTLAHLKKMLKKQPLNQSLLPKDAAFVNKNVLQTIWSANLDISSSPSTVKHFNLKRKTKAAAQRAEFLQKSHDAPNQTKIRSAVLSHHVPIKGRDTVRKMDTNTPMKGIPSQNPNKLSAGFSTTSKMYTRPVITKKEGGAKLIDIAETPEMLKKRRKEIEKEEKANQKLQREEQRRRRQQERDEERELKRKAVAAAAAAEQRQVDAAAAAVASEDETMPPAACDEPPSYVADLLAAVGRCPDATANAAAVAASNAAAAAALEEEIAAKKRQREKSILAHHFPAVDVVDFAAKTQPPASIPTAVITAPISIGYPTNASAASTFAHDDHTFAARPPPLTSSFNAQAAANFARAFYGSGPTTQPGSFDQRTAQQPQAGAVRVDMPGQSQSLYFRPAAATGRPTDDDQQKSSSSSPATSMNFYGSQQQRRPADDGATNFGVNRNVVLEAQEMFKTANKLTRPEKALILGFMAGNRDNPCPQMGSVLTVRLSENVENQLQMDGTVRQALIETYFQMNYENGEWKKLRKTRIL